MYNELNNNMKKFTNVMLYYCLYNSPYDACGSSTHLTLASISTKQKKNKERCCEDTGVETSLFFTVYVIQMDQLLFIVAIIKKVIGPYFFEK